MIETIHCPYCGCKPDIIYDGIRYIVQCPIYACDNVFCAIANTEEKAISLWNEMSIQSCAKMKGDT